MPIELTVYPTALQPLKCKMALSFNCSLHALLIIGLIAILATEATSKRFCGRELADTLRTLCKNNYNGFGRLTAPLQGSYNAQIEDHSVYEYQSIPFISKLTGGVLSPRVRRKRHGVSDECCKKPCTYKELSNYCYGP
ncbi:unnamed protein product [Hermetia illucens]|uniref:Insulin-like domain-containing protein n=1 Tax=Hermetia illucens TaxID=343691 RepID=A0A7R8UWI3_HERIL|nr:unnamed protein product [Hermetia illucens]